MTTQALKVTTILRSPTDWLLWHQEFRNHIKISKLEDYFDGKSPLRSEPPTYFSSMAAAAAYKREKYRSFYLAEARRRNLAIPDDADTDGFEDFQASQPAQTHDTIHTHATTRSTESFDDEKDLFLADEKAKWEAQSKAYTAQEKKRQLLLDWLHSSVADHYKRTYFLPQNEMKMWYEDLQGISYETKMTEALARQDLHNHYDTIKKKKTVKPTEFEAWIRKWESLWEQADRLKVTDTFKPTTWCEDVLNSVLHLSPSIISTYKNTLDWEKITYRQVARRLTTINQEMAAAQKGGRVVAGSFPTFGNKEAHDHDQDHNHSRRSKPKRRRDEDEDDSPRCRACGQLHPTSTCFYLHPELAYDDWEERPHVRERVNKNLANDATLRTEAERPAKKAKNRPKRGRGRKNDQNEHPTENSGGPSDRDDGSNRQKGDQSGSNSNQGRRRNGRKSQEDED